MLEKELKKQKEKEIKKRAWKDGPPSWEKEKRDKGWDDYHYVQGKPRLYKVPKAVIQAADQRLFEKVTSGEKFITPEDLRFVSNKVLNNVHRNFSVAEQSENYGWPMEEATYINHYQATHSKDPLVQMASRARGKFAIKSRELMDKKLGPTPNWEYKDDRPDMYRTIKDLKKTPGMNVGGIVKKKKKKVVNKYATGGKVYTNQGPRKVRT